MIIHSVDEVIELFPSVTGDSDGELHSPCPYCTSGKTYTAHGITFYGDDRLVWFADRKGVSCRQCGTYASMADLLTFLSPGAELAEDFIQVASEAVETKKRPLEECLTELSYVETLHGEVERAYWKKFLWTDATIDRFLLGYGQLYEHGTWRKPRNIIPFIPRNIEKALDGYMLEGRLPSRSEASELERYNIKTQGSVRGYFWYVQDARSTDLVVVEGPKDAITAWQLGYKNVIAIFGTSQWRTEFARWIADEGYEKVTIFGDNDPAGQKFIEEITKDLHGVSVTPYRIFWPEGTEKGFDLTDALVHEGESGISMFLSKHIGHSKGSRGWVPNIKTFQPEYVAPDPAAATPLAEIRADLPTVLRDFLDKYPERVKSAGRGLVKVLASPPGSGKSFALVQLAQEEAHKLLQRKQNFIKDYEALKIALKADYMAAVDLDEMDGVKEQLAKLETRKENYSVAKVLFASPFVNAWDDVIAQPGFDENLWFNFKPRNEDTCQNDQTAKAIGSKGYSVMKYCETTCPFAADCATRIGGYLMQKRLMKLRPITFIRHANLVSKDLVDEYEVIIIDENFLNVFTDFVTIDNLIPSSQNWRDFADETDADNIELLAAAVAELNTLQEELTGRDCLLKLQGFLGIPLAPLIRSLPDDLVARFQPTAIPNNVQIASLPQCVMPDFYRALMDELDDFEKGDYYNSRVHLAKVTDTNFKLKVSTLFPIELSRNKKIIVADGTAMPELYGMLFNRDVELYQPELYNSKAKIVQLTGTDLSRSTLRSEVGDRAYRNLANPTQEDVPIFDIFGAEVDMQGSAHFTESVYGSDAVSSVMMLLRNTVLRPDHKKILFVTYKNLRIAMEDRIQKLAETDDDYKIVLRKTSFGHYGGLRGTNRYKDCDTVLLAGCPRQPYNELHRVIQAWARIKKYPNYIANQLAFIPAAYHGVGRYEGYTYVTFEDTFAQAFVEMIEAGEIRQCLDRIRIYSEGEKTAYLYMARPAAKWVTDVTSSRMAVRRVVDVRVAEITQFVGEVYEKFEAFPTYMTVSKRWSIPKQKAKEYVEQAKLALNLVSV